jgi:hypothetical protein
MQINEIITELLTTFIAKNRMYNRKDTNSKLMEIVSCTACTHASLVVESTIFVRYDKLTANIIALYE